MASTNQDQLQLILDKASRGVYLHHRKDYADHSKAD